MGPLDPRLVSLKKYIDEHVYTEGVSMASMTDEQLMEVIEVCQPAPTEEDQAFYRLLAARSDRLQQENAELMKRWLESRHAQPRYTP